MKLIRTAGNGRVRYYQLDFKIKNIKGIVCKTIEELFSKSPVKLIEGYELAEDISESVDKIAISDATTHAQRLIFPAFYIKNTNTGETKVIHICNKIHGRHTMLIHGGDVSSMLRAEVYIRALRMLQTQKTERKT
jgi:hypothetical protein